MNILVDADACPKAVKQVLFTVAERRRLPVLLVANQTLPGSSCKYVSAVVVGNEPDAADDWIAEAVEPGDLVITADIPLANRIVDQGGFVITPAGKLLDTRNTKQRVATRNLMDQLRNEGLITGGPAPFSAKDRERFINQLDRFLTQRAGKKSI